MSYSKEFTEAQQALIHTQGNVKVEAVAGSGKTTTLLEYAKNREGEGLGLYLAFNRAIKEEVVRKLGYQQIPTLWVETPHSLAYRSLFKKKKSPKIEELTLSKIRDYLKLSDKQQTKNYLLALHIKQFFDYYCQSDATLFQDLDYTQLLTPRKGLSFAQSNYQLIESGAKKLFELMECAQIPMSHDFYLKKYQLSAPHLSFDWILFDEGQDASPVMLDIFLRQEATKLIVGDEHQQIYGWRSAVNSLAHTNFPSLRLSQSFRCSAHVVDKATQVVNWKRYLFPTHSFLMLPRTDQSAPAPTTHAVIARTHIELIQIAIEWLFESQKIRSLAFEGDFRRYFTLDDGSPITQFIALKNKKTIQQSFFYDWQQIEELTQVSHDRSLKRLIELVKKYGNELPSLIEQLQNRLVESKHAEVTFTTAHKGKGREWDIVHLGNDFITETQIKKAAEKKLSLARKQAINEEINTLYVALTRARQEVL